MCSVSVSLFGFLYLGFFICTQKRTSSFEDVRIFQLGYLDSNQELTESESVALPFGDSPMSHNKEYYTGDFSKKQVLFLFF